VGASDHPLLLTVSKPGAQYAASLKLADGGGSIAVSRTHVEGDSLELRFKSTVPLNRKVIYTLREIDLD
jgi:hypothetical protein